MPLTDTDIKNIRQLVKTEIEFAVEPLKEDIAELKATLPTKDEFYTAMDELVGEIKTIRQEQPIMAHQIHNHEKRLKHLEDRQNFPTV